MNVKTRSGLSIAVMVSILFSGIGISDVQAKEAVSTKITSSRSADTSDKKMVSKYVSSTKKYLENNRSTIDKMESDTLKYYNDPSYNFGNKKFDLMELTSYKKESVRIQAADVKNLAMLKDVNKSYDYVLKSLKTVKSVSDVSKHKKAIDNYEKSYRVVYKSIYKNADLAENLSDRFDTYINKQEALSYIIFGDDLDKFDTDYYKIKLKIDEDVHYEVETGLRVNAVRDDYYDLDYRLNDLQRDMATESLKGFYKDYIRLLSSGNLLGAHKAFVNFDAGDHKESLSKWETLVKKEYDRAFKLK